MNSTTIAVDLAKNVFQIAVSRHPGKVAESHRLTRAQFLPFFAQHQPVRVVMEACGSAHYWGRRLAELGHKPVLLPPHALRAYVTRNKTDSADARALLEAQRNEDIHPVPIKSEAQQTLMALHRLRSTWMGERTARLNQLRAVLRELGWIIPVGARHVVPEVERLVGDPASGLANALRVMLPLVCEQIRTLETNVHQAEHQLRALAKQTPAIHNLLSIPGVGLLTATAVVGFVGDLKRFRSARHFASYLGLTPREHSSGLVRRLGSISKRGDTYLRMLLIHGARALLWAAKRRQPLDRLRTWALRIQTMRGHNRAAVAVANKLARIIWAVCIRATVFHSSGEEPQDTVLAVA
jgi:transposase